MTLFYKKPIGLTFPVLAPDGADLSPSYSFANIPGNGLFVDPVEDNQISLIQNYGARAIRISDTYFRIASGGSPLELPPNIWASKFYYNGTAALQIDNSPVANNTRLLLWDVSAGAFVRVSRGAADSGGVGFRLLRIPN